MPNKEHSKSKLTTSPSSTRTSSTLWSVNAAWVSYAHTLSASLAFLGALVVGVWLHYQKIVQNEHFGYPDEWFPSVSATIGDRYPERSVFQVFIAITSGSRFVLVFMTYLLTHSPALLVSGILRTLTCGGWTYVTSTDDHDWHDIFMISYLILTIPWTFIRVRTTEAGPARTYRTWTASLFFFTLVPLIYFFIQHKVHRIPGAYTSYAFFEWALIVLDLAFDAGTLYEFKNFELAIVSSGSLSQRETGAGASVSASEKSSSKPKLYGFEWVSFVISIANWTMFWTVITAVPLLIWYFPLWHMGISGYEALVAAIMAGPILLAFPFLRSLYAYCPQITFILTTIFGVGSYRVLKPEYRLELTALGGVFAMASLGMQFWGISRRPLAAVQRGSAFSLGLICTVVLKLAWYTNNPMWPIMHLENGGINFIGLVIGVIAASLASRLQYATDQPTKMASSGESSVFAGVGLGGLLFALHSLLSDSSTLILWAWAGYPGGPHPIPHGMLTILAMCAGVYIGAKQKDCNQCIWRGYLVGGVLATTVFYFFRGWVGYTGGLVMTGYLMHLVPSFLESAGRHHPTKSFGIATFIMVLLYLAHVWVVAYAFVPGGPLLRERSDLVLTAQTVCIGAGLVNMPRMAKSLSSSQSTSSSSKLNLDITRRVIKQVGIALTVLLVVSLGITAKRFDRDVPTPHHPESNSFTAGIWTVHFGLDNDMWASEMRMRNLIQELEVDIIGFLESDTQRVIMGNRDLTQQIAEELGYYADFGPGPNQHTWGCCLLSKFPILNSTHHLLPSPVGELAPAIHATLDVYGKPLDVVVFHSGQEEDVEDRRLQSLGVADIMASSSNPLILLSYLVTKPLQGNYNTYVSEHSGMHDIDPSDWDRWCQYILYKDIKRTGYARVSRSTITDTEVQVGKFVMGQPPNYSNVQVSEDQVAESLRFPALFRGQGVRGHAYHVFNEPRYFA